MITNHKKWRYLATKSLSRLLQGTASNHDVDYYSINCLYLFRTESKLKSHKNVSKNHDCYMIIPEEGNKILKYNQDKKYF